MSQDKTTMAMTDFEQSVLTGITRLQTQMEAVLSSTQAFSVSLNGHATRIAHLEGAIVRIEGDAEEHRQNAATVSGRVDALQASVDSLKETRAKITGGWTVAMLVGSVLGALLTHVPEIIRLLTAR